MLHHNGPEHARIVAGALAWAGVTRFRYHADPEFTDVPVEWLLSKEYAAELAGRIREGRFPDQQALSKPGGTTHICVADEQGNCVTMTHTLTACSGVIVPGTGFTWNDGVSLMDPLPGRPNSYNPGRARANAVSPTILFRQGSPAVVVGAPGGWSISSAVLQVISNVVDFGMSPQEAVTAPRFHSEGSPVYCDLRVPTATVRSLRNLGVEVEQSLYSYAPILGRPVCITLDGGMKAGCDARLEGGWPGFARS